MKEQILSALKPLGFTNIGLTSVTEPFSLSFYEDWLNDNLHAEMKYLEEHRHLKKTLMTFLPQAKSVICVTLNYFDHPKAKNLTPLKIAAYAKGEDYHHFFKQQLDEAAEILKAKFKGHEFKTATDSKPILERDFSYQAGLGWIGKNTMLIHQQQGSYFLLGEIVTTIELNSSDILLSPHPDRCGTCTKCIEACPTQALTPKKLDANKCISYWTIESKSIPPVALAKKFESWFFGCDICQDVCPWNIKVFSAGSINNKNLTSRESILKEILLILNSSHKVLEKRFIGTPLSRARGFGLKRNALILALNTKAVELIPELTTMDLKNPQLNAFKTQILDVLQSLALKAVGVFQDQ